MTRITLSEARNNLAEAVNKVAYGGERVVLERHGKQVVAMISMEDLALFEELLEAHEDRIDIEAANQALAESDERIPYAQVRQELGLTK